MDIILEHAYGKQLLGVNFSELKSWMILTFTILDHQSLDLKNEDDLRLAPVAQSSFSRAIDCR